jgi:putative membrane protein
MIAAFCTSVVFLVSYLVYHAQVGSVRFTKQGPIRVVYFTILITHTVLAATIVPMVLLSLSRGLKRQYARHRAIARWTMPLWLYVSITGVVVYLMLPRMCSAGCRVQGGGAGAGIRGQGQRQGAGQISGPALE